MTLEDNTSCPVLHVRRSGTGADMKAVHFVEAATDKISSGQKIRVNLDWTRRFDNMQQHSGQHLISALFENLFGIATTSWWMAENQSGVGVSYIEMDKEKIDTAPSFECFLEVARGYRNLAQISNLQLFARNFRDDDSVRFPAPFPELSGRRVLTMDALEGISVSRRDKLEESGFDLNYRFEN